MPTQAACKYLQLVKPRPSSFPFSSVLPISNELCLLADQPAIPVLPKPVRVCAGCLQLAIFSPKPHGNCRQSVAAVLSCATHTDVCMARLPALICGFLA